MTSGPKKSRRAVRVEQSTEQAGEGFLALRFIAISVRVSVVRERATCAVRKRGAGAVPLVHHNEAAEMNGPGLRKKIYGGWNRLGNKNPSACDGSLHARLGNTVGNALFSETTTRHGVPK